MRISSRRFRCWVRIALRVVDWKKWENRLGRTPVSASNWQTVFKEHPEFFTTQGENISLVWRRSRERNYDTYTRKLLSREEAMQLAEVEDENNETRFSRPPLDTAEVSKLVDIAISLHEREIIHRQERRWWITAVIAIVGLIVGIAGK